MLEQGRNDQAETVEGLVLLAVRQHHGRQLPLLQAAGEPLEIEGADAVVGDNHHLAGLDGAREQGGIAQQAAADENRVAAFGKFDVDANHGNAARMLFTTAVNVSAPVSTIKSATSR